MVNWFFISINHASLHACKSHNTKVSRFQTVAPHSSPTPLTCSMDLVTVLALNVPYFFSLVYFPCISILVSTEKHPSHVIFLLWCCPFVTMYDNCLQARRYLFYLASLLVCNAIATHYVLIFRHMQFDFL